MKNLFKALAQFQQEVPTIHKGTQGYGYSYADLPTIFEKINPLLEKHNLGFTQLMNGESLKTIIFHTESGETLESNCDLDFNSLVYETVTKTKNGKSYNVDVIKGFDGMNIPQAKGSIITYFRRYALSSALGLVTDKDTDAAGEQTKKATTNDKKWLNPNTKDWDNVIKALAEGYTLADVKKKYSISKENQQKLENETV